MQIKTLFVLSLIFSFFSTPLSAWEYESSSYDDVDYSPNEFAEPINDPVYNDPVYVEDNDSRDSREVNRRTRDDVEYDLYRSPRAVSGKANYASRLPQNIPNPGERLIVVNPRVHVWGAYTENGKLIRAGLATAGARWCSDIGRSCRTKTGVFRIYSLGDSDCVSNIYPVGEGGAPMPYCMYFNGGQGLHGSYQLAEGNLSHGCVRISVNDAEWIRYNFARKGTKVIIEPY